jgi:type II secretory pathway pseudopilin PulG
MSGVPSTRRGKQDGTLMVALMAGIAIAMILSAIAVQSWDDVLRRDNEAEMMFRAQDIVRALKRYQAAKGKLPVELKELAEPNDLGPAFIRKLWKDPLVKDGKWQLVYLAPGGGLYDPTAPQPPAAGLPTDGSLSGPSKSLLNPTATPGQPGVPPGGANPDDPTGMPIAGVKTRCKDRPFRIYKDKTEYSEWVISIFDLDPRGTTPNQPGQPNQPNQPNPPSPQPSPTAGDGTTFPPTR